MRKTFSFSPCRKILCLVKLPMCVKALNKYFMLFEIAMERTPKFNPVTIAKSHLFPILFDIENMFICLGLFSDHQNLSWSERWLAASVGSPKFYHCIGLEAYIYVTEGCDSLFYSGSYNLGFVIK